MKSPGVTPSLVARSFNKTLKKPVRHIQASSGASFPNKAFTFKDNKRIGFLRISDIHSGKIHYKYASRVLELALVQHSGLGPGRQKAMSDFTPSKPPRDAYTSKH